MVTKYQKEFSAFKEDLSSALAKDTNYMVNETRGIVNETRQTVNETHGIVDETHQIVKKTDQGVDTLSTYLSIHIYTGTQRRL